MSAITAAPIAAAVDDTTSTPSALPHDDRLPNHLVSETSRQTAKLAANGKALMPIVVANEQMKGYGETLRGYLQQITSADFPVEVGDGKSGIVIGTLAQFPDAELDKPLVVRGVRGREAFAIRTDSKRVRLIAAIDKGLLPVIYRWSCFKSDVG